MLYNIPPVITPKLMKTIMEMGHGDEIVLSDGNFPAKGMNKNVIRCDGTGLPALLDAIMQFFPLDYAAEYSVTLMVKPDDLPEPPVWEKYYEILAARSREAYKIEHIGRFDLYDRARAAYAVVTSGERERFANIILKKGIVRFEG